VIYFFICKIGGYRRKVVRENLSNSFPRKTEAERLIIERKFYRHLSELFIDTITLCSLSEKQARRRFVVENLAEHECEVAGRSWICAMAHFGCWEYSSTYTLHTDHQVLGVYRPLRRRVMDRFYHYTRSRFGARPVPMNDIGREMLAAVRNDVPTALALIADQSPPWFSIRRWFDFLNQPTPFFMGIGKMALKLRLPVWFLHVSKVKPGCYTCRMIEIYNGIAPLTEEEITERYAAELERMIRQTPELWLWSHKRWKHKPPQTHE
jgi:KDO2-lipid IV(A) lauroyltransferase